MGICVLPRPLSPASVEISKSPSSFELHFQAAAVAAVEVFDVVGATEAQVESTAADEDPKDDDDGEESGGGKSTPPAAPAKKATAKWTASLQHLCIESLLVLRSVRSHL